MIALDRARRRLAAIRAEQARDWVRLEHLLGSESPGDLREAADLEYRLTGSADHVGGIMDALGSDE